MAWALERTLRRITIHCIALACNRTVEVTLSQFDEKWRPQYHFTPPAWWLNDPNGLVWHDGEYHLFYQYCPETLVWGPTYWGHAVSPDLAHWRHLPVALVPDGIGSIWSGGAVVDRANSSGLLPDGGMVAVFSYEDQSQGIAYSSDRGRNWTMYAGNPVIPTPNTDFRDPKVFWYEPDQVWVMAITKGRYVQFYNSPDLIHWNRTGEFGGSHGSISTIWEVPDLFPLELDGEERWVLLVSAGGGPGGLGVQYFIGDFDGKTFANENPPATTLWLDHGPDNYAGTTWNDTPDDARVYIGWMSNWEYAADIPTSTWRGAMTLPRELRLVKTPEGARLAQRPVESLRALRGDARYVPAQAIRPNENLLAGMRGRTLEIMADIEPGDAGAFGLRVFRGENQWTELRYNVERGSLVLDRFRSGSIDFNDGFAMACEAPLPLEEGNLRLHVFVDCSSVEVFANDGRAVLSGQVFPDEGSDGLELYAIGGEAHLRSLTVWQLASIWNSEG